MHFPKDRLAFHYKILHELETEGVLDGWTQLKVLFEKVLGVLSDKVPATQELGKVEHPDGRSRLLLHSHDDDRLFLVDYV